MTNSIIHILFELFCLEGSTAALHLAKHTQLFYTLKILNIFLDTHVFKLFERQVLGGI